MIAAIKIKVLLHGLLVCVILITMSVSTTFPNSTRVSHESRIISSVFAVLQASQGDNEVKINLHLQPVNRVHIWVINPCKTHT